MKNARLPVHIVYAAVASVGLFAAGLAAILIAPAQSRDAVEQVSTEAAPAVAEAAPVSADLPVKVASAIGDEALPLPGPAPFAALEAAFEVFPDAPPASDSKVIEAANHPLEVGSLGPATPEPEKPVKKAMRPRSAAQPSKARPEPRVVAARPSPKVAEPVQRKPAPVRSAEARLPGDEPLPSVLRLAN